MAAPLQAVGTHGFSSVMALLGPQHLILDYLGLFQGVLFPGPELHTIVRLNRNMTIRVQQHFIRRRNAVLAKQMENFPTISSGRHRIVGLAFFPLAYIHTSSFSYHLHNILYIYMS